MVQSRQIEKLAVADTVSLILLVMSDHLITNLIFSFTGKL